MSFIQPALLYGLPLIALPIIIHLIHRQRHRTVAWGAMLFLLDAKRMTRGMAKLRQFLILALRVLAVAALIFSVSRPLASGWLGGAAGSATDTTVVLLDRSASMEQQNLQTGQSKRETALAKVAEMLGKVGGSTRLVLIDSAALRPMELDSPDALTTIPDGDSTSTTADIPAMLETALDYIEANQTGRTDVWLCTDLRENDWDPASGRWESVRTRAGQQEGLRLFLLSYPKTARDNVSIRVTKVRRRDSSGQAELVIDAVLRHEADTVKPVSIPLEFVVNGSRSSHTVEMLDAQFVLQGHTVPIDSRLERGWGRIGLPADSNPQDNTCYFVFADPPAQETVIVSDDFAFAEAVSLACNAPMDRLLKYETKTFGTSEADRIDWDSAAMVVWQGAIPDGLIAQQMKNFVDSGKAVMFFPPKSPGNEALFGYRWTQWDGDPADVQRVETWRTDTGLLQNAQDGVTLPVGKLRLYRHCGLKGAGSDLARLKSGSTLLTRATTTRGSVWFCGTLPQGTHSSLARDGVVFYVMLHRALAAGAQALGQARMLSAGTGALGDSAVWNPLDDSAGVVASARDLNAGALEHLESGRLVALNRSEQEDEAQVLDDEQLDVSLEGIKFRRIDDEAGSLKSLASEIWRMFLVAMGLAVIAESILCLPEKRQIHPVLERA